MLELGNLMFNPNINQQYECPKYVIALLCDIDRELDRIMWNIYQENYDSPFDNTANTFELDNFKVQAYNWNDDTTQEYNFLYKVDKTKSNLDDIKISWYKYLGRDTTINQELDSSIIVDIYNDCINSLEKFEQQEMEKKYKSLEGNSNVE